MKPIIPFALLGALLAVGAADAAATDPVGYITHDIAGNVAASVAGADTYLGPVLTNPVIFAGESSADPSGLSTITFASGVPTTLDSSHYLEITSATGEGWWSEITSSTSTTVVLANTVPTVGGNVSVKVRKLTTVSDFLGDNAPGLATDADPSPDQVIFLDPVTQVSKTVIYSVPPNTDPAGWVDFVSYDSANDEPIYPGTAVIFRVFGAGDKSFTSTGEVKTGKTQVDIFPGDNLIAPSYAVGNSFNGMNIATQLPDQADQVIVLAPNQISSTFVSFTDGPVTEMVDFVSYDPGGGATVITEGTGFIVRRPGVTPLTVTLEAQAIAPPTP